MNESLEETKESLIETKASIATITEVQEQQGSEMKSMVETMATMIQQGNEHVGFQKSMTETLARLEEKIDVFGHFAEEAPPE